MSTSSLKKLYISAGLQLQLAEKKLTKEQNEKKKELLEARVKRLKSFQEEILLQLEVFES